MPKVKLDIKNYNNDFLIIKSKNQNSLINLGKSIFEKKWKFVEEVITTEREICIKLNSLFHPAKIALLHDLSAIASTKYFEYHLPVYFGDNDDWEAVQNILGQSKNDIIKELMKGTYSLAMFGFLPGFLYLDGLEKSLHVPRKSIPAKYVEANSIAIGGKYLGVYSIDSPGGWHVIGKTPVSILKSNELPPVEINLRDQIKLEFINEKKYQEILSKSISLKEYNG